MSAASKGRKQSAEHLAALSAVRLGRSPSEEAKQKVRLALAGRPKTPEHCAAVSAAKKGKTPGPQSIETRRKRAMLAIGRKHTPEAISNMRVAQSGLSEDAKAQKSARITAALTGKKLSDAHRAAIGAVQRGKPKAPRSDAHRAALSKASKGVKRGPLSADALAIRRHRAVEKRAELQRVKIAA